MLTWLIDDFLLIPFDIGFLRIIVFIMVVAPSCSSPSVVRRTSPILHRRLGIYPPLITTNCAILGVALLNAGTARHPPGDRAQLGAGLGFGW